MGKEILFGEMNWETLDCRSVHSWSCMLCGADWILLGD